MLNSAIVKKDIYYLDTLLQTKEYYWSENKIDSICFFTYDYANSDTIIKNFFINYPHDSLFFALRYKPFYFQDPSYRFELIGNGIITTIPNSDTIFDENYFFHFDRMKSASKYLIIQYKINNDSNSKEQRYYTQAFGLTLNNGRTKYLKRQIKVHFVPLIINDSNLSDRFKSIEILY